MNCYFCGGEMTLEILPSGKRIRCSCGEGADEMGYGPTTVFFPPLKYFTRETLNDWVRWNIYRTECYVALGMLSADEAEERIGSIHKQAEGWKAENWWTRLRRFFAKEQDA